MKTILIIDPDLNLLEVLCHALEMNNYEAIGYSGHELELINLIQSVAPSLILINLTLPSDKSVEWCCRIKSLYPNLPIVAMSCDEKIFKKKIVGYLMEILENHSTLPPFMPSLRDIFE